MLHLFYYFSFLFLCNTIYVNGTAKSTLLLLTCAKQETGEKKRKRVGSLSFQDHVTKKRRALGTTMGGEPHQNSFTEQVFEDAVMGLGYG